MRRFKQYTIEEYLEYLKALKITRQITEVHLHHTWKPTKAEYIVAKRKEMIIWSMWNYHTKTKKWSDIGQHISLAPDGTVWDGRDVNKIPASIKNHNSHAIAIEMIGDFDRGREKLKGEQLKAIIKLIKGLFEIFNTEKLVFHREHATKTCPGTSIKKDVLLKMIKEEKNKKEECSSWAKDAREWAMPEKISDGTNPKDAVTREQAWTMLYNYHKKFNS